MSKMQSRRNLSGDCQFCTHEEGLTGHTEIDHELYNLHNCDVLLPPDADASRALEVVPVHDDVNSQVEGDDGP